jgi:hypothetical protein
VDDPRGGIESPADPADIPVPAVLPASGLAVLRHFEFGHLGADLAPVSEKFHALAHELTDRLPVSPELEAALARLVEAKDWAVRAALAAPGRRHNPPA